MRQQRKAIVITDPLREFLRGEFPLRLADRSLAVHPAGFDWIEPGTPTGKLANQDTHAATLAGETIVGANPVSYFSAEMPRSIVPHQQPCLLTFGVQLFTAPGQKLGCEGRDGATFDK